MPRAIMCVSGDTVSFRLYVQDSEEFRNHLNFLKNRLPNMKWNRSKRFWELPIYQLVPAYEAIRSILGSSNITVFYPDHIVPKRWEQLTFLN